MPSNFPTSLDTLTNPVGTDAVAVVSHSSQHTNINDIIEALEAKLGIGASAQAPSASTVLRGTGAGATAYGQILVEDLGNPALSTLATDNVIINGDFSVWQRGTSFAAAAMGYTADRWLAQMSVGTATAQRGGPSLAYGDDPAFPYNYTLAVTGAATPTGYQFCRVGTTIEGYLWDAIRGRQSSVSFWVYGSTPGVYSVALTDNNVTWAVAASYTLNAASTWERKTVTFPASTGGTFGQNTEVGGFLMFTQAAGPDVIQSPGTWTSGGLNAARFAATGQTNLLASNTNFWLVNGVRLVPGPTALPYRARHIGLERALCQRYCLVVNSFPIGLSNAGYYLRDGIYVFPTTMRAAPTITGSYYVSGAGPHGTFNPYTVTADGFFMYNSDANWSGGDTVLVTFTATAD